MRTEIVIPFALDTAPVEQRLEDEAFDIIVKRLEDEARKQINEKLPKRYGKNDWETYIAWQMRKFLDEHADEVVETAAILLAKKARDKRRWRQVLEEMKED